MSKKLSKEKYYAVRGIIEEGRKLERESNQLENLAYKILGLETMGESDMVILDAFNSTEDVDIDKFIKKLGFEIPT